MRTPAIITAIAKNFMHHSFLFEEGRKVTKMRQRVKRKELGRIGLSQFGWPVPVAPSVEPPFDKTACDT